VPIAEGFALVAGDGALAPAAPHLRGHRPPTGPAPPPVREATTLGLARGYCALQPLPGNGRTPPGYLLLATPGRRALTPERLAMLADAALLAARHLPASEAAEADAGAPDDGAVLPRDETHALIDRARAAAGDWSLLLLDLDRFHAVNEALGVAAGDAVLAAMAARISSIIRPDDRMARIEGDRFLIVGGCSGGAAVALADRILAGLRRPVTLGDRQLVVQASIGVVATPRPRLPATVLLTQAGAALRRAKTEGRNRAVLYAPSLAAAALAESRLELDLAEAPARGQMRLVYQPYVELATGRITGVEALLRWQHPTRGPLAPASFIPLAEATGLILPLGAWALRHALIAAAGWPPGLTVSVNISALQFHQPEFVDQVAAALAAAGVAPGRLELEITETVLMRDAEETTAQLAALIAMGVRIALDDFGTGYSALAYLARLPHHRIKLDRSFVLDLGTPATTELIAAIIALAQKNGAGVTAEGIERPEQLDQVRRLGFTHAQGFATGMPMADPTALMAEA
jgi:diguanylate cyclase (GGDEF)-like protein